MDVVLISPMEISLRQSPRTFRENNVKDDIDSLTEGPLNQVFVRRYRENLGVACLAAYLRERDFEVTVYNANIQRLSVRTMVQKVMELNPLLVGISVLYDLHAFQAAQLIRDIRKAGYKGHITLGGTFASFTYEYFLAAFPNELNSVVCGEGEIPLLQLVQRLKNNEPWTDVKGLAYLRGGKQFWKNGIADVENLENLPFPSRDALDALVQAGIKPRVASLYSSRGCYGQCTYCHAPATAKLINEKKWRLRPAKKIIDEIEYLVNKYGVEYLYFNDDNFMGYGPAAKQRLVELAQGIINRGLKVHFHGECRVDTRFFLDEDFLLLMKRAGLKDILLGLESGSQTTLNRWRKGTTVKGNLEATKLLSSLGFDIEPAMILVDAFTTVNEFADTVKFIKEAKLYERGFPLYLFNRLVVFPGAPIEMELALKGIIQYVDPWDIRHDLSTDSGLYEHIRRISSRPYQIQDKAVAVMWDSVVPHIDRMTHLVDNVIPVILRQWRTKLFHFEGTPEERLAAKDSYMRFVKQLRVWRNNMGELVMKILEKCVELASTLDPEDAQTPERYHKTFTSMISDYEIRCFTCKLEDRLHQEESHIGQIPFEESLAV